jgi:ATP-binding cassette, subfamily B, bacterial
VQASPTSVRHQTPDGASSPETAAADKQRDAARRSLRPLRGLLPFLRPYRARISLAFLALVIAASTVLAIGQGLRALIDQGFVAGDASLLDKALLALGGAVLLLGGATFLRFYMVSWLGERVVADMRRKTFDRLVSLSPAFFESTRTGEVISRLTADTALLQQAIGTSVSIALRNALMLIGGLALMAATDFKLTAMALLVVPLVVVPIVVFGRKVRRLSRASQDAVAEAGAAAEEAIAGIRTVQAFGREALERDRFGQQAEQAFAVALSRIGARSWLTMLVIMLVFGAIGLVLWTGGRAVLNGSMSAGALSAFIFYAVTVAGAVGALSEVWGDLSRAAGAAERLFELMAATPDITAPAAPVNLPHPVRGAIGFKEVRFSYPARPGQSALEGLNLTAHPGERLALAGPSGAGKTTLFQLLLRFYDPQAGSVTLDGVDLRALDPVELRAAIAIVPQEAVIFSGNAMENIRYGRPGASDAEVKAAAAAARAADFIEALPQGYATYLGEKGVRLSGGQRQRIAIARAILRDAPILLLDEATSALDAESERAVQQALETLMHGRTTLIIAHRLSTIVKADRIAVLDHGRLVAVGRHDDLVAQGGLYARLAALQFDQSA